MTVGLTLQVRMLFLLVRLYSYVNWFKVEHHDAKLLITENKLPEVQPCFSLGVIYYKLQVYVFNHKLKWLVILYLKG